MKAKHLKELNDFIPYFNSFYGPEGLYPIREVKSAEIIKALCQLFTVKPDHEFAGDSFDRELIRDIIFGTSEHIDITKE